MPNIIQRIEQILKEKEPLSLETLIDEIKSIAYIQDKVVLDEKRIKNQILLMLQKNKILKDFENLLYLNTPQNMFKIHKQSGITIKHYSSNQEITLGSPGMKLSAGMVMTFGDYKIIENNPDSYFMVLDVDLPLRLEVNEQLHNPYVIKIGNKNYNLFHKIKKRGEENFSCLDTNYLPYFSSLQISAPTNKELLELDKVQLLYDILKKINNVINNKILEQCINYKINLPFTYAYIDPKQHKITPITNTIVFLTTDVEILGKNITNEYPREELRKLLNSEKIVLQNKIEDNITEYNSIYDFSGKIFRLTHDFSFYIRQTPEIFNNMNEEFIRDVYLFCTRVGTEYTCEAEAFNYDGKSDFKIISNNKYEYIIGEFKWWTGDKSIEELCNQGLEKHVTGQEKDIYLIMLSRNNTINIPKEKSLNYIRSRSEILEECHDNILPEGSKECFYKFKAKIKNNDVNVIFAIIDLHYKRI